MVFLLFGTKVATAYCEVKLSVCADLLHRSICNEDCLSVDYCTKGLLRNKNNETCYQKAGFFHQVNSGILTNTVAKYLKDTNLNSGLVTIQWMC